ncbi:hypothetical protein J132_09617, partial [Termitomyces sp. J132]
FSVFCNGSGAEGSIKASAVMFISNKEVSSLKYHLSLAAEHTVYEAKIVRLMLGLHLLTSLACHLHDYTIIGSNSQATIQALKNQCPHPTHYLLDIVHSMAKNLHQKQDHLLGCTSRQRGQGQVAPCSQGVVSVHIHWSPSHSSFAPNKWADALAKKVAQGSLSSNSSLPTYIHCQQLLISIPAACQADLVATQVMWRHRWKRSPHFQALQRIDRSLPSKAYLKLTGNLNRYNLAMITQL